jgi:dephospho-CoA kinase
MLLLGLTGGIGMGKSTAADLLSQRGWPVADTDQIARDIVEPGQPALAEIADRFGPEVIAATGGLLRERLAALVFADGEKRRQLESILHPRIREVWRQRVEQWRREARPAGVVVIPLLFETGAQERFDRILCTACSATTQRKRLAARGWDERQVRQRIAAQISAEEKMARSHFVIWTEAGLDVHEAQLDRVIARLI